MLVGAKDQCLLEAYTDSQRARTVPPSLASVTIYMGIKIHGNGQAEGVPDRYGEEKAM